MQPGDLIYAYLWRQVDLRQTFDRIQSKFHIYLNLTPVDVASKAACLEDLEKMTIEVSSKYDTCTVLNYLADSSDLE